jgi:hypothetical protein
MDYKIKKKKEEFEPVTVEITLNTPDELAWFTGCINLGPGKVLDMNDNYLLYDRTYINIRKKDSLWTELNALCYKHGLSKD